MPWPRLPPGLLPRIFSKDQLTWHNHISKGHHNSKLLHQIIQQGLICHRAFQSTIVDQDCLQESKSKERVHRQRCNDLIIILSNSNRLITKCPIFQARFKSNVNQHLMQLQKVYLGYRRVFQSRKVVILISYQNQCQYRGHLAVVPTIVVA